MSYSDLNELIGKMLQEKRNERNMSQKELGQQVGYSQSEISRFEKGEREMGVIAFFSIANELDVDLNSVNPFDY